MSVLQYGSITTIDVPWTVAQDKTNLMNLVDLMQREGGPSQIGNVGTRGWRGLGRAWSRCQSLVQSFGSVALVSSLPDLPYVLLWASGAFL